MNMRKLVDIDNADIANPINKGFTEAIDAHSRIAEFYRYRPPYTDEFFEGVCKKLEITPNSVLLDLCCGRGELASRLAKFSKQVFAVDGSEEMLKHKIASENVTYLQCDINEEMFSLPAKADHLVIGSAIHWVRQASLQKIMDSSLAGGGKVLVSHTLLKIDDRPYYASLSKVNAGYGKQELSLDLMGVDKLAKSGYQRTDGMRIARPVQFGIDYLINHQLSYLYRDFYDNVSADIDGYRNELHEALAPFMDDGKLSAVLVNWGAIYSPANQKLT